MAQSPKEFRRRSAGFIIIIIIVFMATVVGRLGLNALAVTGGCSLTCAVARASHLRFAFGNRKRRVQMVGGGSARLGFSVYLFSRLYFYSLSFVGGRGRRGGVSVEGRRWFTEVR